MTDKNPSDYLPYPSFDEFREREESRRDILARLDEIERKLKIIQMCTTEPDIYIGPDFNLMMRPNKVQ